MFVILQCIWNADYLCCNEFCMADGFFVCGYTYMGCEHIFIVLCIVVFTVWVYYVEWGVFGEELSGVALYCCITVWVYLH